MCKLGYTKLAEMLIQKSAKFNIDLNAKDIQGKTGFHWVCIKNETEIAEMLIQKSAELKIDLNAKDQYGITAFDYMNKILHNQLMPCLSALSRQNLP